MKNLPWIKIFFVGASFFVKAIEAEPLRLEVMAPIAILINAENGKVLFSKNADLPCYPASTTKVASVLYALHRIGENIDQKVVASADAVGVVSIPVRRNSGKHPSYRLEFGGTHAGIKVKEELDYRTLIYGAMLVSGNDATNVLAENVSGSVGRFVEELNHFLQAIGCKNTYFTNPHGLPDPRHTTTAADLAHVARFAKKNPFFKEVVSTVRYQRPETNKQEAAWFLQNNALLKPGKYYYPHATGIKSGWTISSKHNFVASAQKGDRNLIAVVCGCEENAQKYRTVVQLFEAAFNEPKQIRKLLTQEHDLFHHVVEGGKTTLHAMLKEDLVVSYYPSEELEFSPKVTWNSFELPIQEGQTVGMIRLFDQEGKLRQTVDLLSTRKVEPTFGYRTKKQVDEIARIFKQHRTLLGYVLAVCVLGIPVWIFQKRKKMKAT